VKKKDHKIFWYTGHGAKKFYQERRKADNWMEDHLGSGGKKSAKAAKTKSWRAKRKGIGDKQSRFTKKENPLFPFRVFKGGPCRGILEGTGKEEKALQKYGSFRS